MAIRLFAGEIRHERESKALDDIVCQRYSDVIHYLRHYGLQLLSIDFELKSGTGYDALLWIEKEMSINPKFNPPKEIVVGSASPVERAKMQMLISSIKRWGNKQGDIL